MVRVSTLILPVIIFASVTEVFPSANSDGSRIINGTLAQKGRFPWQAALIIEKGDGYTFCGGSLISTTWVLTAAHCTDEARTITVKLGLINLQDNSSSVLSILASKVVQHPNYNAANFINDISLIYLSQVVTVSSYIKPIKIASSALADGTVVLVSGWGRISDDVTSISPDLYYTSLTTISNTECAMVYNVAILTGGIVCVKGDTIQSICNGDSGGPVMTLLNGEPVVVGVVSFGATIACGIGVPTGHTRVAAYRQWILANTGDL